MTTGGMKVNVKIKKLHPDAVIPKYARELDAGFDLVAVEDTLIAPGESAMIRTGLAMALPPGYELQVRPRSGVSAKTKLRISNAPGTIDAGYRGEICVLIDNTTPIEYELDTDYDHDCELYEYSLGQACESYVLTVDGTEIPEKLGWMKRPKGTYLIRKGDRIAQGVLAAVPIAQFEVVDVLDETERGSGGFGSSGVTA